MAQPCLPSAARRSRASRQPRRHRQDQGLSLAELLIGMVISIVVLGAAVRVLVSLTRGDGAGQVELNRKDSVGRVLGLLQDEIRNAQRVDSGGSLTGLSGCSTTPQLILRGTSSNEDIAYGLLSRSDNNWRGPAVLVRCGPNYNADGSLNAGTTAAPVRSEQIVLDGLQQTTGFAAQASGGSGTVSRHVELTLRSNLSGLGPSVVQVPISSNQVYGLASSGITACQGGTSLASGCLDPNGESKHYKPILGGGSISGSTSLEDVFYFDGNRSEYTLSRTPGSGTCTQSQCTVRQDTNGSSVTLFDGDVLIFKDVEIRI